MQRVLVQTLFLALVLALPMAAQSYSISINRLEIENPWNGFYYEGQGSQLWGKAVIRNASKAPLRDGTITFQFYDSLGTRETFTQPLPVLPPGGVATMESPQWWDYSGARIDLKVTVQRRSASKPLAERSTGATQ